MAVDARVSEYLLELLRCALHDETPSDKPEEVSWQEVFLLAKRHSVSALAWQAVSRLPEPIDPAVNEEWRTLNYKLINKYINQEHELVCLCEAFVSRNIPYMPLKGSCIRDLYPEPYQREMADLDILIHEEDLGTACDLALSVGYCIEADTSHNVELLKKPYMCLELHRNLVPTQSVYYAYYKQPWQFAQPSEKQYCYEMTKENYYVYMLVHTAKHYYGPGTGIRSYLDIFVFLNHYQERLDRVYIEAELKKIQIYEFAMTAESLAFSWFSKERPPLSEKAAKMANYVFSGSTYGRPNGIDENKLLGLIKKGKSEKRARLSFFMQIVFPSYDRLSGRFPSLKKAPFLLPFYWIWRWLVVLFTKPGQIIKQYRRVKRIDVLDHE